MNDAEIIAKGDRVAKLLNDGDLKQAFASVREAIVGKIESCPMRDTEGAEKLRIMLKLLNDVRANLEQAIADGKITNFRLQEAEKEKRRFSIFR